MLRAWRMLVRPCGRYWPGWALKLKAPPLPLGCSLALTRRIEVMRCVLCTARQTAASGSGDGRGGAPVGRSGAQAGFWQAWPVANSLAVLACTGGTCTLARCAIADWAGTLGNLDWLSLVVHADSTAASCCRCVPHFASSACLVTRQPRLSLPVIGCLVPPPSRVPPMAGADAAPGEDNVCLFSLWPFGSAAARLRQDCASPRAPRRRTRPQPQPQP
jgi:hypothetical protein